MNRLMNNLNFNLMSFCFKVRDFITPPKNSLSEAGIMPGFHVLDYGCGPGTYSIVAAEIVGESGKVYALDINPLGLKRVQSIASKRGLRNIETIQTDCATGLENSSIDVALLYDTLHDLANPDEVLKELYRILKPNSILSLSDHHMKEDEILSEIAKNSLFELSRKEKRSYIFLKV